MPDKQTSMQSGRRASITSSSAREFRNSVLGSAYVSDDRRQSDRTNDTRRFYRRTELQAEAKLRAAQRISVDARVQNLSAKGCCLEVPYGNFAQDECVWFKIDGFETWKGTVRWVDGGKVGIEFDHPFYPSVFEYILALNMPLECQRAA